MWSLVNWPIAGAQLESEPADTRRVGMHLSFFGVSIMRKLVSAALLTMFVSASAMAQTTPAPTGPADCKANETWDAVTKTCKLN
jgi:hypothetical protein